MSSLKALKKLILSSTGSEIRRIHICTAGLVAVVLTVAVSVWFTAARIERSIAAASLSSQLSQYYLKTATTVHILELIERDYQLQPSGAVRADYDNHVNALASALEQVAKIAPPSDSVIIDALKKDVTTYAAAARRLFEAVDRGDVDGARKIDVNEADPLFGAIERRIVRVSALHQASEKSTLDTLQRRQADAIAYLPPIIVAGLVLIAVLLRVLRSIRVELQIHRDKAEYATLHDSLTGLANRTGLEKKLKGVLESANDMNRSCALFLIDLDRFHDVNDILGHHAGDQLLALVGKRLYDQAGPVGTVARLAGDEFAILLPGIRDADAALAVAEGVQRCLLVAFEVENAILELEASIGIAISSELGNGTESLFRQSDIAMYRAKLQKCGVAFYNVELDRRSPSDLSLLGELRRGIERDELFLQYQPKINAASGQLCGVEALVRWKHPRLGIVPPNDFVALAERTGLIKPLSLWVINAALKQAKIWILQGVPIQIAINVSARNLADTEFAKQILSSLENHDVPASSIMLEITESAVMVEPDRVAELLDNLHRLGIKISIDDFGAGYTSLAQLKTLPINELKIDRSFVQEILSSRKSALIVRSMIGLGHGLKMNVVAEGVEDQETAGMLKEFGCDTVQGYFFSQPLAPENIPAFAAKYAAEAKALASAGDFVDGTIF